MAEELLSLLEAGNSLSILWNPHDVTITSDIVILTFSNRRSGSRVPGLIRECGLMVGAGVWVLGLFDSVPSSSVHCSWMKHLTFCASVYPSVKWIGYLPTLMIWGLSWYLWSTLKSCRNAKYLFYYKWSMGMKDPKKDCYQRLSILCI